MKQRTFGKALAVAVILLFLGLAVQPSVAISKEGNSPPDRPDIIGPTRGKPGVEYDYIFVTTDPDDDDVSYYIEWGDGTSTGWTEYIPSGWEMFLSHSWDGIYDYSIRVKAKDIHGLEGKWTQFEMIIPDVSNNEDECNKNDTSIGLGFIVCIVYGIWDPGFPMGLIFEPLVPVICEDLDTGSSRFGITRLIGFHIFKFLPIGHNYNIKIKTRQNWREQTVSNLNFINIVTFILE